MAWSAPSTRSTLDVISATNWNEVVNDLLWLGRDAPHCSVYNSANISISDSARTALTFNGERYDTGGCHSTVSNTGRLTVPSGGDGVYLIWGSAEYAAAASGVRNLEIRLNGSTLIAIQSVAGSGTTQQLTVAREYLLSAGDYVELTVFQNSGGSVNIVASGNYSPEFGMSWRFAS